MTKVNVFWCASFSSIDVKGEYNVQKEEHMANVVVNDDKEYFRTREDWDMMQQFFSSFLISIIIRYFENYRAHGFNPSVNEYPFVFLTFSENQNCFKPFDGPDFIV